MANRSWNNVLIGGDRAYVSKAEAEALLDARDTLLRDMAVVLREVDGLGYTRGRPILSRRLVDVLRRAGEIRPA